MKLPFAKTPLEKAFANRDRLVVELIEDEKQVLAKREAQELAYDNGAPETEKAKARAALIDAKEHFDAQTRALKRVEALIAALKAEQAEILDKETRAKTETRIKEHAVRLIAAKQRAVEGLNELSEVAAEIASYILDAKGLEVFCGTAAMEIPPAVDLLSTVMKSLAQSVLNGQAAAILPQPTATPPAPVPQPAPLVQLFAVKNISWTADGALRLAKQWTDVSLSPKLAQRALRFKAAVPMNDPIRRKQTGYVSNKPLRSEACTNLDSDEPAAPDLRVVGDPLQHSAFEKPTIGAPYSVRVPRGDAMPATASRTLPEDKS